MAGGSRPLAVGRGGYAATPVLAISDLPAPNLPLKFLQFTSNVVVTATTAMPTKTQKMLRADFTGSTCF